VVDGQDATQTLAKAALVEELRFVAVGEEADRMKGVHCAESLGVKAVALLGLHRDEVGEVQALGFGESAEQKPFAHL
jgi:hypothetical protein